MNALQSAQARIRGAIRLAQHPSHPPLQPNPPGFSINYAAGAGDSGQLRASSVAYIAGAGAEATNYIFTKTKSPTCQILNTSRTWGDLLFTMKVIKEVWEAIQTGVFPHRPITWKCSKKYLFWFC